MSKPRTSTFALNNATLPFVLALAERGVRPALAADPHLLAGLSVDRGRLVLAGARAPWGGFRGYFADPDGFLWEVCHNPFFRLDEQGFVRLPE